jgi:hypothetical protein
MAKKRNTTLKRDNYFLAKVFKKVLFLWTFLIVDNINYIQNLIETAQSIRSGTQRFNITL